MYIVWTKGDYGENWLRQDCQNEETVKNAVLTAAQKGEVAIVTTEVPYQIRVDLNMKPEPPPVPPPAPEKTEVDSETHQD